MCCSRDAEYQCCHVSEPEQAANDPSSTVENLQFLVEQHRRALVLHVVMTGEDVPYKVAMRAGQSGNTGKVQFKEYPGPAYVSADVPGRGIRPHNAFTLKNTVGAVPNIGPIKGATAYGASWHFSHVCMHLGVHRTLQPRPATGCSVFLTCAVDFGCCWA